MTEVKYIYTSNNPEPSRSFEVTVVDPQQENIFPALGISRERFEELMFALRNCKDKRLVSAQELLAELSLECRSANELGAVGIIIGANLNNHITPQTHERTTDT